MDLTNWQASDIVTQFQWPWISMCRWNLFLWWKMWIKHFLFLIRYWIIIPNIIKPWNSWVQMGKSALCLMAWKCCKGSHETTTSWSAINIPGTKRTKVRKSCTGATIKCMCLIPLVLATIIAIDDHYIWHVSALTLTHCAPDHESSKVVRGYHIGWFDHSGISLVVWC